jgi:hypothetical protein
MLWVQEQKGPNTAALENLEPRRLTNVWVSTASCPGGLTSYFTQSLSLPPRQLNPLGSSSTQTNKPKCTRACPYREEREIESRPEDALHNFRITVTAVKSACTRGYPQFPGLMLPSVQQL